MKYIYYLLISVFLPTFAFSQSLFIQNTEGSTTIDTKSFEYYLQRDGISSHFEKIYIENKPIEMILTLNTSLFENTILKTNHTHKFQIPKNIYLTGKVKNIDSSFVSLSVFQDKLFGLIEIDNNAYIATEIENGKFVFTKVDKEANIIKDFCKNELLQENLEFENEILHLYHTHEKDKSNTDIKLSNKRTIKVALESDFEFFSIMGNDSVYVAEYILGLWATVNSIYERDANVRVSVPFLNIWTVDDPYPGSNASTLLNQFKDYWKQNDPYSDRSVASLISGHIGQGGLAWVGQLCNEQWGYSFMTLHGNYIYPRNDYFWDLHVTSHELGHNVGLVHTHNCNWEPPIDSCYEAESGNCFTQTVPTVGTIMSYCHLKAGASVDLHFHSRCVPIVQAAVQQALCTPMTDTPSLTLPNNYTTCNNTSVEIGADATGGTPPYSYLWIKGSNIQRYDTNFTKVNPQNNEMYVLRVRDANNYEVFDTTIVYVTPAPEANIVGDAAVCEDKLHYYYTKYDNDYTYKWYVDGAEALNSDTMNYMELIWYEPGVKTLKVVVSQRVGVCVDSSVFKVDVLEMGIDSIAGPKIACQYSRVDYSTSDNDELYYFWKVMGATKKTANENSCSISLDTLGFATIRLIAQHKVSGCLDSVDYHVEVLPQPVAEIICPDTLCEYSEVIVTTPMPEFDVHNTWSITNGKIILQNDSTLIFSTYRKGIINIGLKSENFNGSCIDSVNKVIDIIEINAPEIQALKETVCVGEICELYTDFIDMYNYYWSANSSIILNQDKGDCDLRFLEPGKHQVRLIIEHKDFLCRDTSYFEINVIQGPEVSQIDGEKTVCRQSIYMYKVNIDNTLKYKWIATDGNLMTSDDKFYVEVEWYGQNPRLELIVESQSTGCESTRSLNIEYYEEAVIDIQGSQYICNYDKEYEYVIVADQNQQFSIEITGGNIIKEEGNKLLVKWLESSIEKYLIINTQIDANGCEYSYPFKISDNIADNYQIVGEETLCYNSPYEYKIDNYRNIEEIYWFYNGNEISNNLDLILNIKEEGTLQADLYFLDSCFVSITKQLIIEPTSGALKIVGTETSCFECVEEYVIESEPNAIDFNVEVENGNVIKQNKNKIQIQWENKDSGKIVVTPTENGKCNISDTLIVALSTDPNVVFDIPSVFCVGDTLMLETTNLNYSVLWDSKFGIVKDRNSHKTFIFWSNPGEDTVSLIKTLGEESWTYNKAITIKSKPNKPDFSIEQDEATSTVCSIDDNSNCEIQWYYNGEKISGANQLTLPLTKTGYYRVEHISEYDCSEISDAKYFEKTSVSEELPSQSQTIMISPNPTSGSLNIESTETIRTLEIFDVLGVMLMKIENSADIYQNQIDLSSYSSGIYYISINDGAHRLPVIISK